MNSKDQRFFALAREASKKSDFRQKMGCVVVYKNHVISEGHNQTKTHPLQVIYDKERPQIADGFKNAHSLHAESAALFKIKDMDIPWNKVDVYIYRSLKSKDFGLAKPCPSCTALIKELGIKRVHYTSNEGTYITEEWLEGGTR